MTQIDAEPQNIAKTSERRRRIRRLTQISADPRNIAKRKWRRTRSRQLYLSAKRNRRRRLGGCDRLAGCLSAYSPLLAELVESAADVLKFVLKTEPKGMDDNDGGIGSGLSWKWAEMGTGPGLQLGLGLGSELRSGPELERNMGLEFEQWCMI